MNIEEKKLDNPVWNSLNEIHSRFCIDYENGKFYKPDYCPFGGFFNLMNFEDDIEKYATNVNNFYVVGNIAALVQKDKLIVNKNLVCNQMVLKEPFDIEIKEHIYELKSYNQKKDLYDLVNFVQPGYFNKKTSDLGKYFGMYKNNKLIATTGERMKMNKFTEVSAVVTHPDHSGKGYAKQLIKHTTEQIFRENKVPYLHVLESNIGAIKLYEKLGFSTRRKISFWNLIRK
ncbi:GNAT family N-acetyltransferase [Aquimarina algiphila]|uniref:GNAT family N-acetyltransferase n=1 Tax=Aquimarina algiphila TaxID=2047982 RepID=UPI002490C494|nr:GNAT family N-acetyltransferase [Aquimarina algiphila]